MEIDKYKKLEEALKELKKPNLKSETKLMMKSNILSSIKHEQKLKNIISKLAEYIKPNSVFKARLGQTLLAFTKSHKSSFAWQWQKVFASALLFVIVFMIGTVYVSDIPVIKAARQTTIVNVSGEVNLIRDEIAVQAEANMYLQQGDILITGENGTAIVRYIDDSISRLSPNSELGIRKLYQDQIKRSKTEVEIEVKKGKVWNQVVSIVGKESSFKVEVKDVTANASERASFEVKADERAQTLVSVYDNRIEVSLQDEKQMVLEGYSIAANPESSQIAKININLVEDQQWVDENIAKDKQYKDDVVAESVVKTKSEAGLTPESPLYSAKKLNESTKLLLTSDPVDNTKLKIEIALKRLNEATVYINEDKSREADPLIQEFRSIIRDLSKKVSESEELKEYFIDAISDKSKDFAVILPDDPLYKVKEALREAKLTVFTDVQEIKSAQLKEVEEKIIEVKDLLKEEKNELAQETLIKAQEKVVDIAYDNKSTEGEDAIGEQVNTLNSAKVLVEVAENETVDDPEIVKLAETTHEVLENDIKDSLTDPDVVITEEVVHLANTVIDEQVQQIVDEKLNPVVSDSAVILEL
jgi:hypothetical protein